jgi:hypothetical protein
MVRRMILTHGAEEDTYTYMFVDRDERLALEAHARVSVEKALARLEAENAKLRDQVHFVFDFSPPFVF